MFQNAASDSGYQLLYCILDASTIKRADQYHIRYLKLKQLQFLLIEGWQALSSHRFFIFFIKNLTTNNFFNPEFLILEL